MKILLKLLQESEWSGATRAYHKLVRKNADSQYRAQALDELGHKKEANRIHAKRSKINAKLHRAYSVVPKKPENEARRNSRSFTLSDVVKGITRHNRKIDKYKDIYRNH